MKRICVGLLFIQLLATGLAAPRAMAGSRANTPEFFYQPGAGLMAVSLEYSKISPAVTIDAKADDEIISTTRREGSGFSLGFHFSFSENWAIQVSMGHREESSVLSDAFGSIHRSATGLTDLRALLTNITPFGGWNLHVGIGLGISPGEHLDENATQPGNIASGGASLQNYLGLSTALGSNFDYGLKIAYLTRMRRTGSTNTSSPATYELSGGNELSMDGFFEANLGDFSSDVSAGFAATEPVSQRFADDTTTPYGTASSFRYALGMQYMFPQSLNFRVGFEQTRFSKWTYDSRTDDPYTRGVISARLRHEF